MRVQVIAFLLICTLAFVSTFLRHTSAQSPDDLPGLAELKKGDYENAIKILSARLATNTADAEAEKNLLRAYLETGRYTETETSAKKFLTKEPAASGVRHQLAEVFATTGRYTESIAEFQRASTDAARASGDKLSSDLRRAEILELIGQQDQARPIFETLVAYYQ